MVKLCGKRRSPAYTWRTVHGTGSAFVTTSTFQVIARYDNETSLWSMTTREEDHRWGIGRNRAIR